MCFNSTLNYSGETDLSLDSASAVNDAFHLCIFSLGI